MEASAANAAPWTVERLLAWTRAYLERQQIESPRLCAEILLAHALRCERIHLYTRFESAPADGELTRFRELVRLAAEGRPIAYLTGQKDFFSLAFEVSPDVLIPRPETEILVERTIDLARRSNGAVRTLLDLCTGSGCVAVALARNLPEARISASDVSDAALRVARKNAERLGVAERLEFRSGDLFSPWSDADPFDVIVANPPYVAAADAAALPRATRDFEPHLALFGGADGLEILRRIAREAGERLRLGGGLLLEVAFDQAGAVRNLLSDHGWDSIATFKDDLGHERVVSARRAGGSAVPASQVAEPAA